MTAAAVFGAVVDRELVEGAPRPGPGLPLLVGPVWASRLRALREYPGRWGRWPGPSTSSAGASKRSVDLFAGPALRDPSGAGGAYTFRTSLDEAGRALVCARWTPPTTDVEAVEVEAVDLRPVLADLRPAAPVAVPAPVDGSRRPSPRPGAGSTADAAPAATVAPGFQGPEVAGGGTPAAECGRNTASEPSQAEPRPTRGPTGSSRAGGVGAAPTPAPLVKCSACWRRYAGRAQADECAARHQRALEPA